MVLRQRPLGQPVQQFRREIEQLMSDFLGNLPEGRWPMRGRGRPAANLWETGEAFYVELEVPGVKSEQIELSVAGNELSLKITRSDVQSEEVVYHRRERPVGEFTRVVRLPADVEAEQVEAELRNGVLTIKLPKAETAKLRKIKVSGM